VLEVHAGDGQLVDTSAATLRILTEVDRPNLTVNLQPPLRGETLKESADRLGPHVTHLHANAWKGEWGNFVYLDQGDEDFEAFLRNVHSHGFDGYISIEHAMSDPIGFAEHNAAYLRELIEKIEGVRS
jgi:sugar phosphate isomerase/epimerase